MSSKSKTEQKIKKALGNPELVFEFVKDIIGYLPIRETEGKVNTFMDQEVKVRKTVYEDKFITIIFVNKLDFQYLEILENRPNSPVQNSLYCRYNSDRISDAHFLTGKWQRKLFSLGEKYSA